MQILPTNFALLLLSGLAMSVGAFSIDIILPFFSVMAAEFELSMTWIQLNVTIYILFLGVGQLVFGPLSDQIGRRPAMFIGLAIYLVGSLPALLSDSFALILVGRACQGIGGAAALVIGRAMIRDIYTGKALAQNMAIASAIFAFGPTFAPLLGVGLVAIGGDWRIVFAAMFVFGLTLAWATWRVNETLSSRNHLAMRPRHIAANIARVAGHAQSRWFLLLSCVALTMMLSIVIASPHIYQQQFGIGGALFAILFAVHGIGIILGQGLNHWLIGRFGVVQAALVGNLIICFASAAILGLSANGWLGPFILAAGFFVFAIGYLMLFSNALSLTLDPHDGIIGFTASFHGFCCQVVGSFAALAIASLSGGNALILGGLLFLLTLVTLAMLLWWLARDQQAIVHPPVAPGG